jgi:uncharacterized protein VirK/YbjX
MFARMALHLMTVYRMTQLQAAISFASATSNKALRRQFTVYRKTMSLIRFLTAARRVRAEFGVKKLRFFVLKYWQYYPWSSRWLKLIDDYCRLHTGQEPPIEMLRTKFLRSYYHRRLGPRGRFGLLRGHYELEATLFNPSIISALMRGETLHLARITDKAGETYAFSLARHERYRAEGEMTLFMRAEGPLHPADSPLAALTFHLGQDRDGRRIVRIGGLQGPAGEDAKQRIISTTRALHGWRPKSAALHALAAFAERLGAQDLEAVVDKRHPLRNDRHAFVAHNDAFWLENEGVLMPDEAFRLPLNRAETRSLEDVPAKKRKDWLARQILKRDLFDQIRANAGAWLVRTASPEATMEKAA